VNENSELERRYRRLLSWYPRDHREQHADEMLGVLLAGAGGRTRPSRGETVDLLRGAARIHLRRVVGIDGALDHRNVWAIVSLLGPVLLLAGSVPVLERLADWFQIGFLDLTPDALTWALWAAVAVLSLLRMRRTAAVGAWLANVTYLVPAVVEYLHWDLVILYPGWLLLGVTVAAALTFSPGPALGWRLVGRWRVAMLVAALGVSVLLLMTSVGTFDMLPTPIWAAAELYWGGMFTPYAVAVVVLAVAIVVAAGVRTREGRRAALVLCAPLVVSVCYLVTPWRYDAITVFGLCYVLPSVVVMGVGRVFRWPTLIRGR